MPSTAFCGTQSAYVDDTESKAFGAMFELLTGEGGGGGGLGLDGEGGGLGSTIGGLVLVIVTFVQVQLKYSRAGLVGSEPSWPMLTFCPFGQS